MPGKNEKQPVCYDATDATTAQRMKKIEGEFDRASDLLNDYADVSAEIKRVQDVIALCKKQYISSIDNDSKYGFFNSSEWQEKTYDEAFVFANRLNAVVSVMLDPDITN